MPDYELVQLIQNSMMLVSEMTQTILVGVFAFLTACYFAGRHLNWTAFAILVALYLLYGYTHLIGMYYSFENLIVLINEASSRPSLSEEIPLYSQENVIATAESLPMNLGLYSLAIFVSVVFGALLKAGKLRVQ
jgi:hypothetical protein